MSEIKSAATENPQIREKIYISGISKTEKVPEWGQKIYAEEGARVSENLIGENKNHTDEKIQGRP